MNFTLRLALTFSLLLLFPAISHGQGGDSETVIVYGNGVLNDPEDAERSLKKIAAALQEDLSPEELDKLEFALAYNPTINITFDLLEAAIQDLGYDPTSFWEFLAAIVPMPESLQEVVSNVVAAIDEVELLEEATVNLHVTQLKKWITQEQKIVIVVAHSQGNLFANEAFRRLTDEEQASFGIASVANPTDNVATDVNFVGRDNHTTLLEDLVIVTIHNAKFLLGEALPMSANKTNLFLNLDPLGHSFRKAYMMRFFDIDSASREKILEDILFMLDALDEPPPPAVGTVTPIPMLSSGLSGVAPEDNGITALVAERWGELSRVELATGRVTDSFFVTSRGIASPVIETGGTTALVITGPFAGNFGSGLARVHLDTKVIEPIIDDGIDRGAALAIEQGGQTALVSGSEGGLTKVNLETGLRTAVSGIGGLGLAIEPGGATALVATGIFGAGTTSCDLMRVGLTDGSFETVAPISCSRRPVSVAIEPGGETALVTTHQQQRSSSSDILRVNLSTGGVTFLASCPLCGVSYIAIEPSGNTALFLGDLNESLIRFNRLTFAQTTLARSDEPYGMVVTSDGALAFTVSPFILFFTGKLSEVDLATGQVERITFTSPVHGGIDLDETETVAYITVNASGNSRIQKINLVTGITNSVALLPRFGRGIAIEGSGNTALVAIKPSSTSEGSLLRVSLTSDSTALISDQLILSPVGVAIEEDGVSALVAQLGNGGTLSRVDLATGAVIEIASGLGSLGGPRNNAGFASQGDIAIEFDGENALVAGASLSRVNLLTGAVTTLVPEFCGPQSATGIALEGSGESVLVSHAVCGILRVQVK